MMKITKRPKIVALIPLRGGSKAIPHKNIKPIAGKPLAFWVCQTVSKSKYIDQIHVSTDDEKIKRVVQDFDLGIKTIDRPKEFATDTSPTEETMLHFAKQTPFDILITLQATSPLTTAKDIDSAIEKFLAEDYDSLLTGVLHKKFFWTKSGKPFNYDYHNRPMRQNFEGVIHENGAFYITKREILEKDLCRLGGKIGIYEMQEYQGKDIDEPKDWIEVEKMLIKHKNNGKQK